MSNRLTPLLFNFAELYTSTFDISPSQLVYIRGIHDQDVASINCSVLGNPLPRITWNRLTQNGTVSESLDVIQAPTGYNETAFSILKVNISELVLGDNFFECVVNVSSDYGTEIQRGTAQIRIDRKL